MNELAASRTLFLDAAENCAPPENSAIVGDGGLSLTLDHHGDEDHAGEGMSEWKLTCFLDYLNVPTSVRSHMEQTTAMDGRQVETWDGIEVSWSYHPDRGMDSVWKIVP